eukprot:UN27868
MKTLFLIYQIIIYIKFFWICVDSNFSKFHNLESHFKFCFDLQQTRNYTKDNEL